MLPVYLRSSYKQYKEDTDSIACWLAVTARKCGYPEALLGTSPITIESRTEATAARKPPRLKGRARKLAREEARNENESPSSQPSQESPRQSSEHNHLIELKNFVPLAEFIVSYNNPPIKISNAFLTLIDRTIALRKKHSKWFNGSLDRAHVASNGSHNFFISILEKVFDILKSRCVEPTAHLSEEDIDQIELSNFFAALPVEEPSEGFINFEPPRNAIKAEVHNELEPDTKYTAMLGKNLHEKFLAAYCLFNDVNELREILNKIWTLYRSGVVNLIPCAVATSTATDLVRKAQQSFEADWGTEMSYEDLALAMYVSVCLARGIDPERRSMGLPYNFEATDIAMWLMLGVFNLLQSFGEILEGGNMPILKPGFFGTYDENLDWSSLNMVPELQFNQDTALLLSCLPDAHCLSIKESGGLPEDDFIRLCRHLRKTRRVELWSVFAAQVFLDINHVLGPRAKFGFNDLQTSGSTMKQSIEKIFEFQRDMKLDTWSESNNDSLRQLVKTIDSQIFDDIVVRVMNVYMDRNQHHLPRPPRFRLMEHNPVLCGLMQISFLLDFQEGSIVFANAWGATVFSAHLYNALQQERLLSRWPDMDLVISFHTPGRIFIGDRPDNVEDYLKRFSLAIGVSASVFASDRRRHSTNRIPQSTRGPRGLNENVTPICRLFRGKLIGASHGDDLLVLPSIEAILKAGVSKQNVLRKYWQILQEACKENPALMKAFETRNEPVDPTGVCQALVNYPFGKYGSEESSLRNADDTARQSKLPRRFTQEKVLSPVELVQSIFDAVSYELPALKFDYFSMHRMCWNILLDLKDVLEEDLRGYYGQGWLENETKLPFIIGYILNIATKTVSVGHQIGLPGISIERKMVLTVAHTISIYLKSGLGAAETTILLRDEQHNLRLDDIDFRNVADQHGDDEDDSEGEDRVPYETVMEAMAALRAG